MRSTSSKKLDFIQINRQQARRLLIDCFLLDRWTASDHALTVLQNDGAVQYDPVSVVGSAVDLYQLARIRDYVPGSIDLGLRAKSGLCEVYHNRTTYRPVEVYGKHTLAREAYRAAEGDSLRREYRKAWDQILARVERDGPLKAADIDDGSRMPNHWGRTSSVARMLLDAMAQTGDAAVIDRIGNVKVFDLPSRWISAKYLANPFSSLDRYVEFACSNWIRRSGLSTINSVRDEIRTVVPASDRKATLQRTLDRLEHAGDLAHIQVEDVPFRLLMHPSRLTALDQSASSLADEYRLLPPLDPLVCDRKMLSAIFEFDYVSEVYLPAHKRRYGYYVLPILHRDQFVGRVELRRGDGGTIRIDDVWAETGSKIDRVLLDGAVRRLGRES